MFLILFKILKLFFSVLLIFYILIICVLSTYLIFERLRFIIRDYFQIMFEKIKSIWRIKWSKESEQ